MSSTQNGLWFSFLFRTNVPRAPLSISLSPITAQLLQNHSRSEIKLLLSFQEHHVSLEYIVFFLLICQNLSNLGTYQEIGKVAMRLHTERNSTHKT